MVVVIDRWFLFGVGRQLKFFSYFSYAFYATEAVIITMVSKW